MSHFEIIPGTILSQSQTQKLFWYLLDWVDHSEDRRFSKGLLLDACVYRVTDYLVHTAATTESVDQPPPITGIPIYIHHNNYLYNENEVQRIEIELGALLVSWYIYIHAPEGDISEKLYAGREFMKYADAFIGMFKELPTTQMYLQDRRGFYEEQSHMENHWGVTIDDRQPIGTVYQANDIEYLDDEIYHMNGSVDLAHEAWVHDRKLEREAIEAQQHEEIEEMLIDLSKNGISQEEYDAEIEKFDKILDDFDDETSDGYETGDHIEIIFGDWKQEDGKYVPYEEGTNGYAAILIGDSVHVQWSRETMRRGLCSPCAPGQCYYTTPGRFLCYKLPDDVFGRSQPFELEE